MNENYKTTPLPQISSGNEVSRKMSLAAKAGLNIINSKNLSNDKQQFSDTSNI